jgi:glucosamine--fructose-6-phosphate aminotransferase (isomerizing)
MLLIAVSQSGTTTDTNRTVDVAGSKGAWIHAIVNRRNSPLINKSDSHSYTSDGRDVEMAVASTKAFYSQVAAGKLLALLLASELKTMTDAEILHEIEDLQRLPSDIEWVLDQRGPIKECAEAYGPTSRNWAVVGNGPNKIAADEIRIKLSELCYKSIPCDFTEDKKHIDLSTEPLTIVVANDLPEVIVQDTTKEVAIFRAHNGKPIVLCARGEKRFGEYAERLIELPRTGGGLGFVLATVAGHLWGFHAARAIDAGCEKLRRVRGEIAAMLEESGVTSLRRLQSMVQEVMEDLAAGRMNAALPASIVASLALFMVKLHDDLEVGSLKPLFEEGISILSAAVEEATRPIDSIRHQAKTVTVGISRPQEIIPELFVKALEELAVSVAEISEQDRRVICTVSPVISGIHGGLLYRVVRIVGGAPVGLTGEAPWIRLVARTGTCAGKPSRYDDPKPAGGTKRTVLRLERALWSPGRAGKENLVVIPLFDEEKRECVAMVLFHLDFVPQATLQQKLSILSVLGNRYHEVVERLQELMGPCELEDFLESVSPRDLVLAPIDSLIHSRTW